MQTFAIILRLMNCFNDVLYQQYKKNCDICEFVFNKLRKQNQKEQIKIP